MKRFSKTFSGISAIMLGVGIILIAVGIGRAKADWEKLREENPGSGRMEREFTGIEDIDIKLPFGYMKVGTSADGKVHFHAEHVDEGLMVQGEGGELSIRMDREKNTVQNFSFFLMGLISGENNFIIQEYELLLPEDYRGKMEIDFGGGKLDMDGVYAGEINISMDAGELTVSGCTAGKLNARCDIGETKVEGRFRDISVQGDIGAVGVIVYGEREDYKGAVHCGIGELGCYNYGKADIADVWHWEGGFGVHEKWEGRRAAGKLEVKCDIGEVSVMFSGDVPEAVVDVGVPDEPQFVQGDGVAVDTGADVQELQRDKIEVETE